MSFTWKLVAIGFAAGIASGLFGIGGGVVMVPLLVLAASLDQHRAHAASLAAGIFLGAAGGITYALEGNVDLGVGALLATGAIVGAPLGARLMDRTPEASLKIVFGLWLVVLSISLALR